MNLAFFDTNILLCGEDASALDKQKLASALFADHLRRNTAVLSVQVLQEFFNGATRRLKLDPEFAQKRVETFSLTNIVRIEANDVIAVIELHRLRQISFWDALIVHAARISGATVLYSEDLQHKSVLGGVRIVNPFIN
jgi:predicted nucleic acid-binding protein